MRITGVIEIFYVLSLEQSLVPLALFSGIALFRPKTNAKPISFIDPPMNHY